MEMQSLQNIIDTAMKAGAEQADIIVDSGESLTVKAEDAKISSYEVSSTNVIGLRVIKNNRIGSSYCETTDEDTINTLVKQALENAEFSKEEALEKIEVARKETLDGTKPFLYDNERANPEDLIELALKLESELKAQDSDLKTPPYNGVGEYINERFYLNHLGTHCTEKSKAYSCYTTALIDTGAKQSMHVQSSVVRKLDQLDYKSCVTESYEHAKGLLDGEAIKTGEYDIVFSPDKLAQFFGVFGAVFSAKAAVNDMNPFKDKLGTVVAKTDLTITDSPLLENGFAYSIFDGEGNLMSDTPLIENGELKSFYHNSYTAKKLGHENNFNATRGPKSTLGVGGTNKVISSVEKDDSSFDKGEYFEIITDQGMHSGSDYISGDFSFAASGYLVRDGKRISPVKGVTVSGNFYEVLKNISNIGQKVESNTSSTFFSPKIRFKGMSVAGN